MCLGRTPYSGLKILLGAGGDHYDQVFDGWLCRFHGDPNVWPPCRVYGRRASGWVEILTSPPLYLSAGPQFVQRSLWARKEELDIPLRLASLNRQ
jgi:hypothetical protein